MATPQEIEQQRLLNQQLMGNAQQVTPGTISTGMEGMNVSPYMFGNQSAPAPQAESAPANNTFNFGDNAPTGQGGIIDVTSPSRGVQVVPDTAPEMYNADRTSTLTQLAKDVTGVTLGENMGNVFGTQKYGAPEDKPFSQSTLPGQVLTLGATTSEYLSGAAQGAGTVAKGIGNVGVGGLEYLTGTEIVKGMGMDLNLSLIHI